MSTQLSKRWIVRAVLLLFASLIGIIAPLSASESTALGPNVTRGVGNWLVSTEDSTATVFSDGRVIWSVDDSKNPGGAVVCVDSMGPGALTGRAKVTLKRSAESFQQVWLVGIVPDARLTSPVIGLRWARRSGGWFPRYRLELAIAVDGPSLSRPDGEADGYRYLDLGDVMLDPEVTYEAVLSYDPQIGRISYFLRGPADDKTVTAGIVDVGRSTGSWSTCFAWRARATSKGPGKVLSVQVECDPGFVAHGAPLSLQRELDWKLGRLVGGTFEPSMVFQFPLEEDIALQITWPGQRLPGQLVVRYEGDTSGFISRLNWQEKPRLVSLGELPAGEVSLFIDYVDGGRRTTLVKTPVRRLRGQLDVTYDIKGRNRRGDLIGTVILRPANVGGEPLPVTVTASYTPADGKPVKVTLKDDIFEFEGESVKFPFVLPLPPEAITVSFSATAHRAGVVVSGEHTETIDAAPAVSILPSPSLGSSPYAIGKPAIVRPGEPLPQFHVLALGPAVLAGEVRLGDRVIETFEERRLYLGEEFYIQPTSSAEAGTYVIDFKVQAKGETFYETFYFTALDPAKLPSRVSRIVYYGPDGKLVYVPDYRGNRIPDFSHAGYMGGGKAIPDVPVRAVVEPGDGDDTERLQAAIDRVSALPPDERGWRGAVLLRRGVYEIGGQLRISAGGVVLRGEGPGEVLRPAEVADEAELARLSPMPPGPLEALRERLRNVDGTVLLATGSTRRPLIVVRGASGPQPLLSAARRIADLYVPVGARSFHVEDATGLRVGDTILVRRHGNAAWIHAIGMDRIPPRSDGGSIRQWEPFDLDFDRVITAIDGNRITVDAPLTNAIEMEWGGGEVVPYRDPGRIEQVGIENFRAISVWAPNAGGVDDTQHADQLLVLDNVKNAWVRRVWAEHFYSINGAFQVGRGAKWVTIEDSAVLVADNRYYSGPSYQGRTFKDTGVYVGRYGFHLQGQLTLVHRAQAVHNRHAFVVGSRVRGPNVFLHSVSRLEHASSEPHHRWSVGGLYDNIQGRIEIQDRLNFGSGHGWAGANYVAWNTRGYLVVQRPPTAQNWAIGHVGQRGRGSHVDVKPELEDGWWESYGTPVVPRSLYLRQLRDRLGEQAVVALGYPAEAAE